jgi:SAM-dependent methyltransferase
MASRLRLWVKALVPEKYRLLRYEWNERLRYYPQLFVSLGVRFQCPFCHWRFRRMRAAGFDYAVLKEKDVVGGSCHPNDVCPRCKSNARERLVYLCLQDRTSVFREPLTALHIAPEPHLGHELRRVPGIRYVSGDLVQRWVNVRLDVMRLPFPDESFDLVLCNHVLEHVFDDQAAMRELRRVLRPEGCAVLQVPIGGALEDTLEDPAAVTEADRIRMFGQRDHVRLYAAGDYVRRLAKAGFRVDLSRAVDCLGEERTRRYAVIREEPVFICRRDP